VLASGPIYASGTFLAGAGVAVAFAALLVAVLAWRLGTPRRLLVYSLPFSAPMLNPSTRGFHQTQVQVLVDNRPLDDPYSVILRLQNKSRRDITSRDFDQEKPLHFDLGVKIVGHGSKSITEYVVSDTAVDLSPALISAGQILQIVFLTDGAPHVTYSGQLINTAVREGVPDDGLTRRRFLARLAISYSTLFAFVGLIELGGAKGLGQSHTLGVICFVIAVLCYPFAFVMFDRPGAMRRRWMSRLRRARRSILR
jgi:hypothetical protein